MVLDIQYNKVEIFADVNDVPTPPTATSAGNGSHLIARHNDLVDDVEASLNDLNSNLENAIANLSGNWIVVFDNYDANPNEKIVFDTAHSTTSRLVYSLTLPNNPPVGSFITFVNTTEGVELEILNFGRLNSNVYYNRVFITDKYITRTLVYCGGFSGWLTVTTDNYTKTVQSS